MLQKRCYPARVANLVDEKEESIVLTVRHNNGPFSHIVLVSQVEDQAFKYVRIGCMNADRLTFPVNPKRHGEHTQSVRRFL